MTTIQIEAHISTEQLLRAVEQLPPDELTTFVDQILALHARREAPHLSQSEAVLLQQINQALPEDVQRRFDALVVQRQTERITPGELQELIRLTEQIEQQDARRLAALVDLARVRGTTVPVLMDTLGIQPPTYV